MALALSFELQIEERDPTRVVVLVMLAPVDGDEGPARLDGVALQLVERTGAALGVQMVLPIAGELRHAMWSTVELRCDRVIPQGARVVGTAWSGGEQREATIPTDPFTELEVHMRARRRISAEADVSELCRVDPEDRAVLSRDFPWIDEPRIPAASAELGVLEEEPEEERIDAFVDNLGLDDESAEWLKDLLEEEA
ncbi:MAG: hypothetical protein ABMA64_26550 [Myxococcota bacterium]